LISPLIILPLNNFAFVNGTGFQYGFHRVWAYAMNLHLDEVVKGQIVKAVSFVPLTNFASILWICI